MASTTEERVARVEEQVQDLSRGFAEVRDSVRHLEQRFDIRFGNLEQRFQYLEQRIDVRFDTLDRRLMTTLVAMISGFVAVIASLLTLLAR